MLALCKVQGFDLIVPIPFHFRRHCDSAGFCIRLRCFPADSALIKGCCFRRRYRTKNSRQHFHIAFYSGAHLSGTNESPERGEEKPSCRENWWHIMGNCCKLGPMVSNILRPHWPWHANTITNTSTWYTNGYLCSSSWFVGNGTIQLYHVRKNRSSLVWSEHIWWMHVSTQCTIGHMQFFWFFFSCLSMSHPLAATPKTMSFNRHLILSHIGSHIVCPITNAAVAIETMIIFCMQ